jgi:4-hydroxy 2-oxovalerate aldolase
MKNVKILDCTLRDGGRVINCAFPDEEIKQISSKLASAKIDIIEVGFLRDHRSVSYEGNSTFFTDVDQIKPFVDKSKKSMYVAFVDYGMFDFDSLKPFDGLSVDGLRVGFTKKNFVNNLPDVVEALKTVKQHGYKLFVQGVNSLDYSDKEMLNLIDMVDEIQPTGFGMVDTYGAMYVDDVTRIYSLIDHNLSEDIAVDFHSHNNFQLSFAFAQEIIKLSNGKRKIIIDSTLAGMGHGAGNLNTELIVDYMVRKLDYDYELDNILDIIDEYIYDYNKQHWWGYSIPALMAGIYKSHQNNVIYLTEKFRLDTKDIKYILSMIDPQVRQRYDYDNIERLYIEYGATKIDDYEAIRQLKSTIGDREVLVLVPGRTLTTHRAAIESYVRQNSPFVISVNFCSDFEHSALFFGNQKRYNSADCGNRPVILTSNVKSNDGKAIVVNYEGLINREGVYFDNSTIMLLNLLRKLEVKKLAIAGFDGFTLGAESSYMQGAYQSKRHESEYEALNKELKVMFGKFAKTMAGKCDIKLITPSMFE